MSDTSELNFIERRLEIVEKRLKEVSEYEIDTEGRLHICYQTVPARDEKRVREASLLEKIIVQKIPDGKIHQTLTNWRKALGEKLKEHNEYYRPLLEEHDRWSRLPFPTRIEIPEPPFPPDLEVTDYQGMVWIVDEIFLSVLDDLKNRLEKWGKYEE